jgi:hypothetical protein
VPAAQYQISSLLQQVAGCIFALRKTLSVHFISRHPWRHFMTKLVVIATVLLSTLIPTLAFAQTSNATLGGTVSDSSGALIPGVTLKATNTQTGIVNTNITNEAGAYQFASLQTGSYRVSAELPGFQTQTYNAVALGVSQQVRLNFTLQISSVAQGVEVNAEADTLIATTSSSIGTVLPEYKVRDLPLASRNVFDLLGTTAGTQGSGGFQGVFAGNRLIAVNTTRDGMNVGEGRYDNGAFSATYTSPDLVEEVRIIVSPADAEAARGSGQVQMTTRAGTNQFRGSLFWANRNAALDANSWRNNLDGIGKDYLNRNQFGGRLGGPIIRNKTFFFFLYEGQRSVERASVTATVLTAQARQGIFRYFPGVQNGNVFTSNPTVNALGNPVRPTGATGDLSSFNVFTRDPLRNRFDPSGHLQMVLSRMPLPNDFTVGDGLNTAGHRWVRRVSGTDSTFGNGVNVNRDQFNVRIDHNLSSNHKLSFIATREKDWSVVNPALWPNGFNGEINRLPDIYNVSLVSTLSKSMVNEFRAGRRRSIQWFWSAMTINGPDGQLRKAPKTMKDTEEGKEAFALIPKSNGIPYLPKTTIFPEHYIATTTSTGRGTVSPLTQVSDTISWTVGPHAFKGGFEGRTTGTIGGSNTDTWPRVLLGAGGVPVTGIDAAGVPGLTGSSQNLARDLLTDLSGSVGSVVQGFMLSNPANPVFKPYPEESLRYREFKQNEWGVFFKDDWKMRPNLTLNIGLRYDYYGVPYDGRGILGNPAGGSAGLFGISGTGFADMFQPGRLNGKLTVIELVGKNSPQPDKQLHQDDWNNFGPAAGLSWSLPWFGRDKTVLRAGYAISYIGAARLFNGVNQQQESLPGTQLFVSPVFSTYTTLADIKLPLSHNVVPLTPLPLNSSRTELLHAFADDRVVPYVQNFNIELQRELVRNLTLEARYIGSKSTKLFAGIPLNTVNIFENGLLDAFNVTRAGGNAQLFDRMLNGLDLGLGRVNGSSVTGSASLRQNTIFRSFIANGDIGQFADALNRNTVATGEGGGLIRNGGLPENFIVVNPQFNEVVLHGNPGNSTYHSMQLQVTKRLSQGFTNQTSYTWSRTLGEADGDGVLNYLDPRNRSHNKSLLGFHRTQSFISNGTYELPFGPNRPLLRNAPGIVQRLVERWQLGANLNLSSGQPLTITASTASIHQGTSDTPVIVGNFPKSSGKVTRVDNGVIYFSGIQQVVDPARAGVTPLQTTQTGFSNRAIADAQGNLMLVNQAPGQLGTLGQRWIEGPGFVGFDANLIKRVRIDERKEFEFRLDAINVLNRPNFGVPQLDINNTSFGRITTATGARSFIVNARVSF